MIGIQIYKELTQINEKKTNTLQKNSKRHIHRRNLSSKKKKKKTIKTHSTSPIIRKMPT